MINITASDIESWTIKEPRRAQEKLPLLIWKLIIESCEHINDQHFPFDKAIHYNGYDGFLDTDDESRFVPKGKSVWEFGTEKDSKGKFNIDYEKRTQNSNGIILAETTFCFVTTRIWNHRQGITEATVEKTAEGKWRGVRILDANSIQMWLETCPQTTAWFSDVIGKPSGSATLNQYEDDTLLQKSICEKKLLGSIWGLIVADMVLIGIDYVLAKYLMDIIKNNGYAAVEQWYMYIFMMLFALMIMMCGVTYQLIIGKRPLDIYRSGTQLYIFIAKNCPYCGARMKFCFDDKGAAVCKCRNNERDHCIKIDHTKL